MSKLEEKDINKFYVIDEFGVRRIFAGYDEYNFMKTSDGMSWPEITTSKWETVEIKPKVYKKVTKYKAILGRKDFSLESDCLYETIAEATEDAQCVGYIEVECTVEE
jgi:hypothetical protein